MYQQKFLNCDFSMLKICFLLILVDISLSLSSPPFQRLPHSERELEEIGIQISCSEFSRGKKILEVKKEEGKISKSAPKKRGRP